MPCQQCRHCRVEGVISTESLREFREEGSPAIDNTVPNVIRWSQPGNQRSLQSKRFIIRRVDQRGWIVNRPNVLVKAECVTWLTASGALDTEPLASRTGWLCQVTLHCRQHLLLVRVAGQGQGRVLPFCAGLDMLHKLGSKALVA